MNKIDRSYWLGISAGCLCGCLLIVGCVALFGEPAWTEPATYDAAGAMVSGTVEHPATPGLIPKVAEAAAKTDTPWGLIIASGLGLLTTIVQTVRGAKKVAPAAVVEAVDYAQQNVAALRLGTTGDANRCDIGDLIGQALRTLSPAEARKVQGAFRASKASRKGK